ncbi:methyl-accepting chemotaxis protein [Desulfovibrio inopinatus]|uniref:methyl-accepting chemotaxis protein n=1 Tax=Desulfovibrio inopinatus TaxID=102109 RepID=UPI00040D1450|nr:methyl-accepting chemotaxis protein [Desulfovibrio inopinatus]
MLQSLHFRLAATMLSALVLVTLAANGLYSIELGSLGKDVHQAVISTNPDAVQAARAASQLIEKETSSIVFNSILLSLAIVGIAAVGLGLLIRSNLLKPLEQLTAFATDVAEGNLESRVTGHFIGRLAMLKTALETMLDGMKQALNEAERKANEAERNSNQAREAAAMADKTQRKDEVRREGMLAAGETLENVASSIKNATRELKTEAQGVSQGAEIQSEVIGETADSVDSMLSSIFNVAQLATDAAQAAKDAKDKAENGSSVVLRSVDSINQVRSLTESLKVNMSELGKQAESIGQVMTVISDIADQTNLLALNAAIEAARAGDAGRGFAVVADEVRKLAEKTMSATHEVGRAIQGIQQGAFDNIKNMDEAANAVAEATDLAGESREALTEIVSLSDNASDRVLAIAQASDEQVTASERIKNAIDRISEVSSETAEGMLRSTQTIDQLGHEIEELIKLNGVFKLIGQGTAQDAVEELALHPDTISMQRQPVERLMRHALSEHHFMELLYATDAKGIQFTENIGTAHASSAPAKSVLGSNWTTRPWFRGVMENEDTYISPIYESQASGEYCLTIATPIVVDQKILGVFAADIKVFG